MRAAFPAEKLGLSEMERVIKPAKEKKHVAIVTVIGKELQAVLRAVGRVPSDRPDQKSGDFSYWFARIDRPSNTPLSVVITIVSEPRNVPAAIAVDHLVVEFEVGLLMLVGIAAGVRGLVKLGDVVYGHKVYDYEGVRLEIIRWWIFYLFRPRPRPKEWNVSRKVNVARQQFDVKRMCQLWTELMQNAVPSDLPKDWTFVTPAFKDGTIAAGEKLMADGSLYRMYRRVVEEIRAGAMEDSGFVQAAEANEITWCIFRGIADFGDQHKSDSWHLAAAIAAAAAAITFLRDCW
jgi:nucleoside phosphorylase